MDVGNIDDLMLFLFTTDLSFALEAQQSGIDSVIVDWEHSGKRERQQDYSTEINIDTPDDVSKLSKHLHIPVTVRINCWQENAEEEIEVALDCGAKIIMLPMAEGPTEVEKFVKKVNGRAKTIIQIETQRLVEQCHTLHDIGWDCAYIGLNDLMVSRGSTWIWEPFIDGTVEHIFEQFDSRPIGVAGVTIIGGGEPLPFTLLVREMARLGCRLSFLRRTFMREIVGRNFDAESNAIRATWIAARQRQSQTVHSDHLVFRETLIKTKDRQERLTMMKISPQQKQGED